ncbi:MAG: hypothetical protein AAGU21_20865 [Solidesulfovibrio sp.]|jgi:hypothetical protein|uniref:hypothetical protein n=1 Tax=Solidesulfovibrio sp. TaxID=2910990 RepID=UPI002B218991|nr:hypothetical protein [Solidesulfovibrio sp.]MEA4854910.1 hypothetical protein [Solidesulfovibrio sp.]
MPRILLALVALALAACAPVANGELARILDRQTNDCLTQVAGRQDFRTMRQKTPSFLLP